MSVVTNVILTFAILEDEDRENHYTIVDKINEWMEKEYGQTFNGNLWEVGNEAVGGAKNIETPLYIAAFNYLDTEGFVEHLKGLPWLEPENVQMFIQEQDDERFTVYTLT